jgi:hypothetical protein
MANQPPLTRLPNSRYPFGYSLGSFDLHSTAFWVLFVRSVNKNRFERVGIGEAFWQGH